MPVVRLARLERLRGARKRPPVPGASGALGPGRGLSQSERPGALARCAAVADAERGGGGCRERALGLGRGSWARKALGALKAAFLTAESALFFRLCAEAN